MKNKAILLAFCAASMMVLSGCADKNVPDEFMVLKNAPLALPPEYYLTPDGPYSDLDDATDPTEIARRALFGDN